MSYDNKVVRRGREMARENNKETKKRREMGWGDEEEDGIQGIFFGVIPFFEKILTFIFIPTIKIAICWCHITTITTMTDDHYHNRTMNSRCQHHHFLFP